MNLYSTKLTLATVAFLFSAFTISAQNNSVSIGTTSTNSSAVLYLNSPNGNQGLIIPVGNRANVLTPAIGMLIFDNNSSPKQLYVYDGSNWGAVGGGASAYTLSYNSTTRDITLNSTSGSSTINISTITLSGGDLSGNLGAPTVVKLNGKNLPAFTAGVLTSDANGNLTWSPASGSLPAIGKDQILSNDGTNTKAVAVAGDLTLSTGTSGTFSIASTSGNNIVTAINSAATTGSITDSKLAAISTPGKVSGAAITSGNIATSGNISTTGTLTSGATGQFSVSSTGDIKKINNVTTAFPAAQGAANTVLTNDGTGKLSWAPPSSSLPAAGVNQILTSDNTSALKWANTIPGSQVVPSFGAQALTAGSSTVTSLTASSVAVSTASGLSINGIVINWPNNQPGVLTNAGSGALSWSPTTNFLTSTLPSGDIIVGNSAGVATPTAMNGDATLSSSGALTIANNNTTGGNIIASINSNSTSTINGARVNPSFGNQNITTTLAGAAFIAGGINAGGSNQFSIDGTGNITKINNVPTNFPSAQGTAGTVLTNDGTGKLNWATPTINPPVQVPANTDVFEYTGNSTLRLTINNLVGQYELGKLGSPGNAIFATNWSTGDTYIAGKLGVGVNPPVSALDVSGDLHLSQLAAPPAATADKLYNVGGSLFWNGANISSSFSTSNTIPKGNGTGLVASQIYDDGTNVGIGTNSPSHKLTLFNSASPPLINFQTATTGSSGSDGFMVGLDDANGTADIWSWEAFDMKFGTSSSERMRITSGGNVGIGTSSPASLLDVNGNAILRGTVTAPATGSANLIPIAYGNITSSGGTNSGTGNFTVVWNGTSNWYEITITGQSYNFASYVTSVTPWGSNATCSTNSVSGKLLVIFQNLSGTNVQNGFQFVVYKP